MAELRFAQLAERLLRAGVSPRHLTRLVRELEDHFADIVAELARAGHSPAECESLAAARLGSDEAIAASILARPELKSWARRWPWLGFVLLPLVLLPAEFVLTMALAAALVGFSTRVLGVMPAHGAALRWTCQALLDYALWGIPAVLAALTCLAAIKRRAPWHWPALGVLLIVYVGALTNASVTFSAKSPHVVLGASIGFAPRITGPLALRIAASLAVAALAVLWVQRSRLSARRRASGSTTLSGA